MYAHKPATAATVKPNATATPTTAEELFEGQGVHDSQTIVGMCGQAAAAEGEGVGVVAGAGEGTGVTEGIHGSKNVTSISGSVGESGSTIGPGGTTTLSNATLQYSDPTSHGGLTGHGGTSQFIQIVVGDERLGILFIVIGTENEAPNTGQAIRFTTSGKSGCVGG